MTAGRIHRSHRMAAVRRAPDLRVPPSHFRCWRCGLSTAWTDLDLPYLAMPCEGAPAAALPARTPVQDTDDQCAGDAG